MDNPNTAQMAPEEAFVLWLVMEEKDGLCRGCEHGAHIHVERLSVAGQALRDRDETRLDAAADRRLAELVATAVAETSRPLVAQVAELTTQLAAALDESASVRRMVATLDHPQTIATFDPDTDG